MKVIGTKYSGLDSSICFIDSQSEQLLALQSDRVSRIKKDSFDIDFSLKYLKNKKLLPAHIDKVAIPFSDFTGLDAVLEMQSPTYFWLKKERIKRKIIKPRYFQDLNNFNFYKKILLYSNFKWILNTILHFVLGFFRNIRFLNRYYVIKSIKSIFKNNNLKINKIEFYDHHLCHAASILTQYNFDHEKDNFIFILDEHGDRKHSSFYKWHKKEFINISQSLIEKFKYQNKTYVTSIGNLYSNFTEALGLRRSTDEGKVEALAAYGSLDKRLFELLKSIIEVDLEKLNFKINTNLYKKFLNTEKLKKEKEIIGDKNFAATIQFFLEHIVITLIKEAKKKYGFDEIFVAGGVFANVIMSYKIYDSLGLKKINVVPFMGDEGSAVGAGILSLMNENIDINFVSKNTMPYFGSEYLDDEIEETLKMFSSKIECVKLSQEEMIEDASQSLFKNDVICTFHGKMEFGPRSLGNRSILANPFYEETRDKINLNIKRRPWYQPLCPSILEEDRNKIFKKSFNHKFMSTAFKANGDMRKIMPSALHVDLTARPQFIDENDNLFFYKLLKKIKIKYGYGVVLNTSFNMHGRTNVLRPKDAIIDFLDCNLDSMYIGSYKVKKN